MSIESPTNGTTPPQGTECKKHKIRCYVPPGSTTCRKCASSGIPCVVNSRFTQRYVDEDAAWKTQAANDVEQLKSAVQQLLQHTGLPPLSDFVQDANLQSPLAAARTGTNEQGVTQRPVSAPNYISEGPAATQPEEEDAMFVSEPMDSLYNLTESQHSRLIRVDPGDANGPDFISKGSIGTEEAEFLFLRYRDHINPLLWDGVLCPHRTLQEIRQASTLLTATVLTVGALHTPHREKSLEATYGAFVALMRQSVLLKSQSLDDIRGLCIGAFYLTSLSWALSSRAVRIATEMGLHRSSLQFSRGSFGSYERVQVWYMLYVCDHHFALAYGRPPLMHDDAAIRNVDKFLASGLATSGDVKLIAQVSLFRILAESYLLYGCDPDLELSETDYDKIREFTMEVEKWRLKYQREPFDSGSGSAGSTQLLVLYYHFARFQLNSLALRGIAARDTPHEGWYKEFSFKRREAADVATSAAISTLQLLVEADGLKRSLIAMPIFTHAMIAVCASFILKIAVSFGNMSSDRKTIVVPQNLVRLGLSLHTDDALSLVHDLTHVLRSTAQGASNRHVMNHIVTGLDELCQRFIPTGLDGSLSYSRLNNNNKRTAPQLSEPGRNTNHSDNTTLFEGAVSDTPRVDSLEGLHAQTESVDWFSQAQDPYDSQIQDPYDLMGDLDWRFNDSFLWRVDANNSFY